VAPLFRSNGGWRDQGGIAGGFHADPLRVNGDARNVPGRRGWHKPRLRLDCPHVPNPR
jgi:hypothetical protein